MAAGTDSRALIAARVARSTAGNLLGKFLALGLGFLITPFVLDRLGVSTYALWVLAGSIAGYGWLLELGISGAVIKYVAEHYARGEIDEANNVIATALWIYCVLAAAAIGLTALFAPLLPGLFRIPAGQLRTMTELLYVLGLVVALSIPCTLSTAILRGLQRYDLASALSAAGGILSAAATVTVLVCGGGVLALAKLALAMMALMQAPSLWLIRRCAPELHIRLRLPGRASLRKLVSFSSPLLVLNMAGAMQSRSDDVIVGAFLPVVLMTPFALARKLATVPLILADQFMKVLLPLASELHAESASERLRELYLTGTRLALAILVPVGSVLAVLASPILVSWVGPAFAQYGGLTAVLAAATVIDASQWTAGLVLQGMSSHHVLARVAVLEGIANVAISMVLVGRLGLMGVALGILIPKIGVFVFVFLYSTRTIGVSPADAIERSYLPALIPALPMIALLYALRGALGPGTWASTASLSLAALTAYFLVYLGVSAGRLERELARSTLSYAWRLGWQPFISRREQTR